jgi:hypothetical protein
MFGRFLETRTVRDNRLLRGPSFAEDLPLGAGRWFTPARCLDAFSLT